MAKKRYTLTYQFEVEVEAEDNWDAKCEGANTLEDLFNWHVDWILTDVEEGEEVEEEN